MLLNDLYDVMLSDFGLSRHFQTSADVSKRIVGTYNYMAPEVSSQS